MRCRICGAKQSIRKVFASSTKAKDVRKAVQSLNLARGSAEEDFEEREILEGDDGEDEKKDKGRKDVEHESRDPNSFWGKVIKEGDEQGDEVSGDAEKSDEKEDLYTTVMPGEMQIGRKMGKRKNGVVKNQRRWKSRDNNRLITTKKSSPLDRDTSHRETPLAGNDRSKVANENVQDEDGVAYTMGDQGTVVEEETVF